MLDKKIYTKAVAISPSDLEYLKDLRDSKIWKRTSVAGTLAEVIDFYRKNHAEEVNTS